MPKGIAVFLPSAWQELAQAEYAKSGYGPWDNAKLSRFCEMLVCTPREACVIAGVLDVREMRHHHEANRWPLHITLHWEKILRMQMGAYNSPDTHDILTAKLIARRAPPRRRVPNPLPDPQAGLVPMSDFHRWDGADQEREWMEGKPAMNTP